MKRNIIRYFSKYKKLDNVITSLKHQNTELKEEKKIKFKPFINSVYEKFGNIKPFSEKTFNLTIPNDIPLFMYEKPKKDKKPEMPNNPKILKIAIFGPTNTGKSLLLNKISNRFISAVSNKSFTSNKSILGINTDMNKKTQLIFQDLPGFQNTSDELKNYGQRAFKELDNNKFDVILIVLDCNKKISKEVLKLINLLNKKKTRNMDFILVLNKIDLCYNRRKLVDLITYLEGVINVEKKLYISAETDYGIEELKDHLKNKAKDGEWLYDEKYKTDLSEIEILEQIVKSIIYNRYYQEFPYEIQTKIVEFVVKNNRIYAEIQLNCERPIHKDILIGKKGQNTLILKNYIQKFLTNTYNKEVEIKLDVRSGFKIFETGYVTDKESITGLQKQQVKLIRKGEDMENVMKNN